MTAGVFVEAPARLHFGVLDLGGSRGRWFGGIGAAVAAPTLLVSASHADTLEVLGEDAQRAAAFARRFVAHHKLQNGTRVRVHRALPGHVGLGSGTQLALAVARALAELHGLDAPTSELARAVGRAHRSAVGTWIFDGGGFVIEGGRRPDRNGCGPLLARLTFPPTWRCAIAIPEGTPAISGETEAAAFARLPAPPEADVTRVAHTVLMALLPALADADLPAFGAALTEIQRITGRWFDSVQGGTFASGPSAQLVESISAWGASGVGQSSWGPAVYGIVDGVDAGARLAECLRQTLGTSGTVYEGPFRACGARVWRDGAQTGEVL